jgi:hypothetical protein
MTMIDADTASLIAINSVNALLLGLSGVFAYEVLPVRRKAAIAIHFVVMGVWAITIALVSYAHGDGQVLIERRWINTAATLYIATLIALHYIRARARREVR